MIPGARLGGGLVNLGRPAPLSVVGKPGFATVGTPQE
jgi:hypothetical protein